MPRKNVSLLAQCSASGKVPAGRAAAAAAAQDAAASAEACVFLRDAAPAESETSSSEARRGTRKVFPQTSPPEAPAAGAAAAAAVAATRGATSSRFRCVYWAKTEAKWRACIWHNSKKMYVVADAVAAALLSLSRLSLSLLSLSLFEALTLLRSPSADPSGTTLLRPMRRVPWTPATRSAACRGSMPRCFPASRSALSSRRPASTLG